MVGRPTPNLLFPIALVLLIPPALLINLGLLPLLADEPTRASVALEMLLNQEYLSPSIGGSLYLNKPPLFNWLLLGLTHLLGGFNEFNLRVITIISLIAFSTAIYFSFLPFIKKEESLLVALLSLVTGRILFYDSQLALMDTLFSALIFCQAVWAYIFFERKQFWRFYLLLYLIGAIAFLLKTLPAILFLSTSICLPILLSRKWNKLWHTAHIISIVLFFSLLGLYYVPFISIHGFTELLSTMWDQSAQRTAVVKGWEESLLHFISFPFTWLFHFFPSLLLVLFVLRKATRKTLLNNPFSHYLIWWILANVLVYWFSPETRPRYLFMFVPMLIYLGWQAYCLEPVGLFKKAWEWFCLILIFILALAPLAVFMEPESMRVVHFIPKLSFALTIGLCISFLAWQNNRYVFHLLILSLLTFRIAFNWFILPYRYAHHKGVQRIAEVRQVARMSPNDMVYCLPGASISHESIYYFQLERGVALKVATPENHPEGLFLANDWHQKVYQGKILGSFTSAFEEQQVHLIQFAQP